MIDLISIFKLHCSATIHYKFNLSINTQICLPVNVSLMRFQKKFFILYFFEYHSLHILR